MSRLEKSIKFDESWKIDVDFEFKFWWDFVAGSDKKALNIQATVYFLSSFELSVISNERLGSVA